MTGLQYEDYPDIPGVKVLVIAADSRENSHFAKVVVSDTSALMDFSAAQFDTFEDALEELRQGKTQYNIILLDGAAVQGDFKGAVAQLPKLPVIVFPERNRAEPFTPADALDAGVDPSLIIPRPFVRGALSRTLHKLVERMTTPPDAKKMRGLFVDRVMHNAYYNGTPIHGRLLSVERDLLTMVVADTLNPAKSETPLTERLQRVRLLPSYTSDDSAQNVMKLWGNRLAGKLAEATNGKYTVQLVRDDQEEITGARIVTSGKGTPQARFIA